MPSFLVARNRLDAAGIAELLTHSHCARRVRGGCALAFADGCDALFVAPPAPGESVGKVEEVLAEFTGLDAGRDAVLRAFRHFAAARGIALYRARSGTWQYTDGCGTGSCEVGPDLTRALMQGSRESALIGAVGWWLKLSRDSAPDWLARPGLPENEVPWPAEDAREGGIFGAKLAAVADSTLCEHPPDVALAKLQSALVSETQQVVDAVVARVGPARFGWQIKGPGFGELEYTDRADSMRLVTRGRRWSARLRELGVAGLAAEIIAEFEHLDRGRGRFLQLVRHYAAAQGWRLLQSFVLDPRSGEWAFGLKCPLAKLKPGRTLTLQLQRSAPRELFGAWLRSQNLTVPDEATLKAWESAPAPVLPERPLVELRSAEECLPPFECYSRSVLDGLADRRVAEFRERIAASPEGRICGEHVQLLRRSPRWYRPGVDTWATEACWLGWARQAWTTRNDFEAGIELLLAGDDSPRAELLAWVRRFDEYHDEACSVDVLRVLRADLLWPVPEDDAEARWARVPWPAADRRLAMKCREALEAFEREPEAELRRQRRGDVLGVAAHLTREGAEEWLTAGEIALLRQAVAEWAQEDDFPGLLHDAEPLEIAARFGWTEMMPLLEANPDFVPAQFIYGGESTLFGPGRVAARISSLGPSRLAERFAALALTRSDRQVELGLSSIHSARLAAMESTPQLAKANVYLRAHEAAALELDRWAGAIAWIRCRQPEGERSGVAVAAK